MKTYQPIHDSESTDQCLVTCDVFRMVGASTDTNEVASATDRHEQISAIEENSGLRERHFQISSDLLRTLMNGPERCCVLRQAVPEELQPDRTGQTFHLFQNIRFLF